VLRVNDHFYLAESAQVMAIYDGQYALKKKSPQTFSRPLAHQGKATRRDVAPMVANFCFYTDVF